MISTSKEPFHREDSRAEKHIILTCPFLGCFHPSSSRLQTYIPCAKKPFVSKAYLFSMMRLIIFRYCAVVGPINFSSEKGGSPWDQAPPTMHAGLSCQKHNDRSIGSRTLIRNPGVQLRINLGVTGRKRSVNT